MRLVSNSREVRWSLEVYDTDLMTQFYKTVAAKGRHSPCLIISVVRALALVYSRAVLTYTIMEVTAVSIRVMLNN